MTVTVVPGSFDPVTTGHMDLISRAAALLPNVTALVCQSGHKAADTPLAVRAQWLSRALKDAGIVCQVDTHQGLLADYCREKGVTVLVRGMRNAADFDYEQQFSAVHRQLAPGMETVCLMRADELSQVSSGIVRQVGALGGDIRAWVPACVHEDIREDLLRRGRQREE